MPPIPSTASANTALICHCAACTSERGIPPFNGSLNGRVAQASAAAVAASSSAPPSNPTQPAKEKMLHSAQLREVIDYLTEVLVEKETIEKSLIAGMEKITRLCIRIIVLRDSLKMMRENEVRLNAHIERLQQENDQLKKAAAAQLPSAAAAAAASPSQGASDVSSMLGRVKRLEKENLRLTQAVMQLEDQNAEVVAENEFYRKQFSAKPLLIKSSAPSSSSAAASGSKK